MRMAADASVINDADNNHVALEFITLAKAVDGKPVGPPMGEKLDAHLDPDKVAIILHSGSCTAARWSSLPGIHRTLCRGATA